ncbi:MAG: 50S ribosomal protein L23 [Patescibacteria group bacterium]
MAIFTKTTEEKEEKKAPAKKAVKKLVGKESPLAARVLLRPRITEKAYAMNTENKFVFQVSKEATKRSVKQAVEEAYGVSVLDVNIVRLPAKRRVFGRTQQVGYKNGVKKAIVKVAEGQTIELFKGGI